MKKLIGILILIVNCGGFIQKENDPLKDPFVLYYLLDNFVGVKNSAIVGTVESNLERLTSPLGQIESKGLDSPEVVGYEARGNFHSIDPLNASSEVGKALYYLAKKYNTSPQASDLAKMEKYLSYFERMQSHLSNGFGRGYVLASVYNKFPECSKNGTAVSGSCGTSRFKSVTIEGVSYYLRYDIDYGTMTHIITGLYQVYVKVPSLTSRVKTIATNLVSKLATDSYLIKDENGVTVIYGDHSRSKNPLAMLNNNILLNITTSSGTNYSTITGGDASNNLTTYDFGFFDNKEYFNRYIIVKALEACNIFSSALTAFSSYRSIFITQQTNLSDNNDHVKAIRDTSIKNEKDFPIQKWHCTTSTLSSNVSKADRAGYDKWENTSLICTAKTVSDMTPNLDFLQAYYSR
jgi:hypothetical protein